MQLPSRILIPGYEPLRMCRDWRILRSSFLDCVILPNSPAESLCSAAFLLLLRRRLNNGGRSAANHTVANVFLRPTERDSVTIILSCSGLTLSTTTSFL